MPIDSHLNYLQKNAFCPPQILEAPDPDLWMVIVIPCFNETDLVGSLQALADCEAATCAVEVITVINSGVHHPEAIRATNRQTLEEARAWAQQNSASRLTYHFVHVPDLPKKHAGVGLARKIGMDEAVHRLALAGQPQAPIVCFDADARCTANYLRAIEAHFQDHPKVASCSIYFEHPLAGDLPESVYSGILRYELYLRYYVQALRWAGHPHAFHTIGSSMAVRADLYQAQGGMNRRKAGEDFHFLQKLIPLGTHSELNTTRVIPSPRPSDRVPFGTGKAIGAYMELPDLDFPVYAPASFSALREALENVSDWYTMQETELQQLVKEVPEVVGAYWEKTGFVAQILECQQYTTNAETFGKRFFRWMNGLKTLQYFHFVRDEYLPNVPLKSASAHIWEAVTGQACQAENLRDLLLAYRELDKNGM